MSSQSNDAQDSLLLRASGLEFAYNGERVLRGASIHVAKSELVALVGPSGSGKTTLLQCLAGVLQPKSGEVWFEDRRVDHLGATARAKLRLTRFGFVFQFAELLPELTAIENCELPLRMMGLDRRSARQHAAAALRDLGLVDDLIKYPYELSGGQAQRVGVARAILHRPSIVFADEPTGSLDAETGVKVLDFFIKAVRGSRSSAVIVTHNLAVADRADRRLTLTGGRVIAS